MLSVEQQTELRQAVTVMKGRGGTPLPPVAWINVITGEVTVIPEPSPSWVQRKMHDGHIVAIGPPEREREGRRISPAGNRMFRELAAGRIAAGAAIQP